MTIETARVILDNLYSRVGFEARFFGEYTYTDEEIVAEMLVEAYEYINRSESRKNEDKRQREAHPEYFFMTEADEEAIYRHWYEVITGNDPHAFEVLMAYAKAKYLAWACDGDITLNS